MKASRVLRRSIERLSGIHLLRYLPRGADLFHDVRITLPGYRFHTVLDVGANVGQSALEYVEALPEAQIHSFEPVATSFERLVRNTKDCPRVICHQLAVGAALGEVRMSVRQDDRMNRVLENGVVGALEELVPMTTVDTFLRTKDIERVSYLKVDTEGHDREVLRGADQALREQRIDLVELEAGMDPDNAFHVPFHELDALMTGHGYRLFGFYQQIHEWPRKAPQLRRANPVYLSRALVGTYEGRVTLI